MVFPESGSLCMDPKIDDRTSISVARSKGKETDLTNDDKDGDLIDAADKLCKAVMECSLSTFALESCAVLKNSRVDTQGSWSSCSPFLAFSQQYKSKFDEFMKSFSTGGIYPINDVLSKHGAKTCPIALLDDEVVFERYKGFKRFDFVKDFSDHLFSTEQPSEKWYARILRERRLLKEGLPETIFVRACESRMDLLRAVIIGPKGTPYHDGLFFFDIYFSSTYPSKGPSVRYRSGGYGINPHLFECGEFRLSLLKTWTRWSSFSSSVLELLVLIQDGFFSADPLFHQPGFLDSGPSVVADYFSLLYNEDILIKSLKTMIYIMKNPPKNFEVFVVGHFRNRARDILMACKAYRKDLQVGVAVGNKESCSSVQFRNDVGFCVPGLEYFFNKIGAAEAKNFSPLNVPTPMDLDDNYKDVVLNDATQIDLADDNKDEDLNDAVDKARKTQPVSLNPSIVNESVRSIEGVGLALVQEATREFINKSNDCSVNEPLRSSEGAQVKETGCLCGDTFNNWSSLKSLLKHSDES